MRPVAAVALAAALFVSIACDSHAPAPPAAHEKIPSVPQKPRTHASPAPSARPSSNPRIVILGDSLTAGFGLPVDQSYPSLLQQRLKDVKPMYDVVNAGVSGDTSAGGLSRLDWALDGDVRI